MNSVQWPCHWIVPRPVSGRIQWQGCWPELVQAMLLINMLGPWPYFLLYTRRASLGANKPKVPIRILIKYIYCIYWNILFLTLEMSFSNQNMCGNNVVTRHMCFNPILIYVFWPVIHVFQWCCSSHGFLFLSRKCSCSNWGYRVKRP